MTIDQSFQKARMDNIPAILSFETASPLAIERTGSPSTGENLGCARPPAQANMAQERPPDGPFAIQHRLSSQARLCVQTEVLEPSSWWQLNRSSLTRLVEKLKVLPQGFAQRSHVRIHLGLKASTSSGLADSGKDRPPAYLARERSAQGIDSAPDPISYRSNPPGKGVEHR